jgi:D-alanyl-D-alanine carboxypeptidase
MNDRAQSLGMTQTTFKNPTGLDAIEGWGATSTARDMVLLLSYLYSHQRDALKVLGQSSVSLLRNDNSKIIFQHTFPDIQEVPGLFAVKTGFTDSAGGSIAMIVQPNPDHVFLIVLLDSTFDGRFRDAQTIAEVIDTTVHAFDAVLVQE